MPVLETIVATERAGLEQANAANPEGRAGRRVFGLFLVVALGVIAKWFFDWAGAYFQNTSEAPSLPSTAEIIVRLIFALVVSGVIFLSVYDRIRKSTSETWAVWFIAFQTGFFWQSLLDAVSGGFAQPGGT